MSVLFEEDVWFEEWLSTWQGEFEWDAGNRGKIEKHGHATTQAIEALFSGVFLLAGQIKTSTSDGWGENRYLTVAIDSQSGKYFSTVITPRGDAIRVISCRRSHPEEEKFYDKQKHADE